MKIWTQQWKKWLVPLCYSVMLLVWLGLGLVCFAADRAADTTNLDVAAAHTEGLVETGFGAYVTEGVDPQLIFEDVGQKIRTVVINATFTHVPGEMELFWVREPGQDFSLKQRVIGVPQDDGSILYRLPAGQVAALRLDLGTLGDNAVEISAVELNPELPPDHYFLPTLRTLLFLALAPALASCAIVTIIECVAAVRTYARRKTGKPRHAD